MVLVIKNNKTDRLINLGTIKGRMLVLGPGKSATLDKELAELFEKRIIQYVSGGFISVDKTDEEKKPKAKVEGDLNGDGVFDKKDKSIAGRVLRKKTTVTKKTKRVSNDE